MFTVTVFFYTQTHIPPAPPHCVVCVCITLAKEAHAFAQNGCVSSFSAVKCSLAFPSVVHQRNKVRRGVWSSWGCDGVCDDEPPPFWKLKFSIENWSFQTYVHCYSFFYTQIHSLPPAPLCVVTVFMYAKEVCTSAQKRCVSKRLQCRQVFLGTPFSLCIKDEKKEEVLPVKLAV